MASRRLRTAGHAVMAANAMQADGRRRGGRSGSPSSGSGSPSPTYPAPLVRQNSGEARQEFLAIKYEGALSAKDSPGRLMRGGGSRRDLAGSRSNSTSPKPPSGGSTPPLVSEGWSARMARE